MLNGYKSYLGAGIIALAGVVLFATGQISGTEFSIILGNAMGIAGIKHAISKKAPKPPVT